MQPPTTDDGCVNESRESRVPAVESVPETRAPALTPASHDLTHSD